VSRYRQQCSGFLYGLQIADAHIRCGFARTVLLVGAEVHSGFMPWRKASWARLAGHHHVHIPQENVDTNSRTRHLTVLFATRGGGCRPAEADAERGVIDQIAVCRRCDARNSACRAWGSSISLCRRRTGGTLRLRAVMDGRYVFPLATTRMIEVVHGPDPPQWRHARDVTMGSCTRPNRRINE